MEHLAICLVCRDILLWKRFCFVVPTDWNVNVGVCKQCADQAFGHLEKYKW